MFEVIAHYEDESVHIYSELTEPQATAIFLKYTHAGECTYVEFKDHSNSAAY